MPFKKGQKRSSRAGRKKGTPNKKTVARVAEFKLISVRLFGSTGYLDKVCKRIENGRAPQLEKYVWEKQFGKEPIPLEVTGQHEHKHEIDLSKRLRKYDKVFDGLGKASVSGLTGRNST